MARDLAGPGVLVEPVVKADAYGHGMVPVARALVEAGADGLGVATFDEAVALRSAGFEGRITVLYPIPPNLAPNAAARRIAVAAGGGEILAALLARVGRANARPGTPDLDVELEIETGLGRGGVAAADVVAAAASIATTNGARLAGVWKHLQEAETNQAAARRAFSGGLDRSPGGIDCPGASRASPDC